MEKSSIKLTYTLPEQHVFSRKPAPGVFESFMKQGRFALGQVRKYLRDKKFERSNTYVRNSYESAWSGTNLEWYQGITDKNNPTPRREGNTIFIGDGLLILSAHMQMLSHIFDQLECNSILDVGSGRGNNIIALASLNPDREFYGVELTKSGYERSLQWGHDLKIRPMPLVDIGEDVTKIDFRKVHFFNSSATALPLQDKSVDVCFTNFALEQIPRDYPKALSEMRRVTRKYGVFIESFRESLSFVDTLDLKNRDQFRFSYKEFERYGFRPVFFSTDFIRKTKFGSGLLIAEII